MPIGLYINGVSNAQTAVSTRLLSTGLRIVLIGPHVAVCISVLSTGLHIIFIRLSRPALFPS